MGYKAFDSQGEMEHTPELDLLVEAHMKPSGPGGAAVAQGMYHFPALDIEIEFDSSVRGRTENGRQFKLTR